MRYLRSYHFLFDAPPGSRNLLAGAACQFVPVLGPIVFTGYAFELIETIPRRGDRDCPAFDLNRLGTYLSRGLRPSIAQLAVLLPVLFVAWIITLLLVTAIGDEVRAASTGPRVVLGLLGPAAAIALLGLSVFLAPLTLYIGLRQDLGGAGMFINQFLGVVGRETLLAQLFVAVTGLSILLIGGGLCCVGVYPAAALVHFAQYHLLAQLYGLYLQRGGKAI